jgi:hypothetical protein
VSATRHRDNKKAGLFDRLICLIVSHPSVLNLLHHLMATVLIRRTVHRCPGVKTPSPART